MKSLGTNWLLAAAIAIGYGGLTPVLFGQDTENAETQATEDAESEAQEAAADVEDVLEQVEDSLRSANLPTQAKRKILEGIRKSMQQAKSGQPLVFEYKFDGTDEDGGVAKGHAKVQIKRWSSDDEGDDDEGESEELEFKIMIPDGKLLELKNMKQMREMLQDSMKAQRRLRLNVDGNRAARDAIARLEALDTAGESRFMLGIGLKAPEADADSEDGEAESKPSVVIDRVFEQSPAAEAGLQSGDEIVKVDDTDVTSPEQLQAAVQAAGEADKALQLTFRRDGEEQTVELEPKKTSMSIHLLPQALRERIAKIRSGADRIIVLDEDGELEIADLAEMQDDDDDNELRELRSDVESLKSDVKEIKAMLKKLSERD